MPRADDQPCRPLRQDDQQIGNGAHAVVAAMGIGVALAIVTTALVWAARSDVIRRRATHPPSFQ
jgi:hypothetical protein